MGRELREIGPDAIYHVVPAGSNGGRITWDDRDCESLLLDLGKAAVRYEWDVFAWCVMSTHYHVLLRTPKNGFSAGLQLVNGNHSRRTNRRHGRSAHLFKNRPYARRVENDAHLVTAIRYVLRNPIAAGICDYASQWPFSSYRATVGLAEPPPWLNLTAVRELLGGPGEIERLVHNGHVLVSDTSPGTASPE